MCRQPAAKVKIKIIFIIDIICTIVTMFDNSAANSATSRMLQHWICGSMVMVMIVMVMMTVKISRDVVMVVSSDQRTTVVNLNQHQLIKPS